MCVLRVRNDYSSTAAFDDSQLRLCSSWLPPASCVREDELNAGMVYQLVLRTEMNYSCAVTEGGYSPITSVLPLTVPFRKEESCMARAMYHIKYKKKNLFQELKKLMIIY